MTDEVFVSVDGKQVELKSNFFSISPHLLMSAKMGTFSVYIKKENALILYTKKGEAITHTHLKNLAESGVRKIFVKLSEKTDYDFYIRKNIGPILDDQSTPPEIRANLWYETSLIQARDIFAEKLPKSTFEKRLSRLDEILRDSINFISRSSLLKMLSGIIGKSGKIYEHGLGTLVLFACVMQYYKENSIDLVKDCCLGVLFHDIGKIKLPPKIVDIRLDLYSDDELELYNRHPLIGVGMFAKFSLTHESMNCVLMHHEKAKGDGFPIGLIGDEIPDYIRVLSVCETYDKLTRVAAWRPAKTPFEALKEMETKKTDFDLEAIKCLIKALTDAEITN